MEAAREEAEKEMVSVNKKLEKKKAELEQLVSEATDVFAEFERRKKAFEEHNDSISDLRTQVDEAKVEVAELRREEAKLADEVNKIKKIMDEREARIKENESRLTHIKKEKLQTKIDDEADDSLDIPTVDENNEEYDESEIIKQLNVLKQELAASEPDRAAIRAWRERRKVLEERQAELDEVSKKRDETKKRLDELRKKRFEEFMTGFNVISGKLREMYRMITLGGDAELEVIDVLDPFSEGVNFTVRPPGKSWKKIQNLSGGEKTLSSLSLVFALHYYKPTPIYIMDEIDAALDFKNVSIVANYIKERTKNAQFLIVSLRNYMFELADRLVGIYKTDNCTKSVTINPHAFTVQQAHN
jgi:structural maintenance of chromosome 4